MYMEIGEAVNHSWWLWLMRIEGLTDQRYKTRNENKPFEACLSFLFVYFLHLYQIYNLIQDLFV